MENLKIEVVEQENVVPVVSNPMVKIVITETRTDGLGNEYPYSYGEFVSVADIDNQIANYNNQIDNIEKEIEKLQAKKDKITE